MTTMESRLIGVSCIRDESNLLTIKENASLVSQEVYDSHVQCVFTARINPRVPRRADLEHRREQLLLMCAVAYGLNFPLDNVHRRYMDGSIS